MKRILILLGLSIVAMFMYQIAHAKSEEIVYQTIAMESSNQSDLGQMLVAKVIINRSVVAHKSIDMICKAPKQFSCWNDQNRAKAWLDRYYTPIVAVRAQKAYRMALADTKYDGINHYHTVNVKPKWARRHIPVIIEGNHAFYSI